MLCDNTNRFIHVKQFFNPLLQCSLFFLVVLIPTVQSAQKARNPKPPIHYLGPPLPTNGANASQLTGSQSNGSVTVQSISDYDITAQQAQLDPAAPAPDPANINYQDSVQSPPSNLTGNSSGQPPAQNNDVCGIAGWTNANGYFQCTATTWATTPVGCTNNSRQCP